MKSNSESVYIAPRIECYIITTGHSLLVASIIMDNQEVVIDRQDGGIEDDIEYYTWK